MATLVMIYTWIMTAASTLTMTLSSGLCMPPLRVETLLGVARLGIEDPRTAFEALEDVRGRVVT
jgi:hypothetical protein